MPNDFSQAYRDPRALLNPQVVKDCVRGILQVASRYLDKPLAALNVLDVGSGTGDYAFEVQNHVHRVVAVEPDLAAITQARKLKAQNGSPVELIHGFIEDVHLSEEFDLAISLTTVEHMPDAHRSFARIMELLRPRGLLYVTAPNRLWPIECHYGLPFLSWLPLPLANLYLRAAGRGKSYQDCSYMRTYWGMKRLFRDLNCTVEFIVPSEDNSYVGVGDTGAWTSFIRRNGIRLIRRFPGLWIISKGFIIAVRKR